MRNRAMSGLTNRGGVWHIDKQYEEFAFAKALEQVTFARAQEHLAKRSDNYFDSRRGGEGLRRQSPAKLPQPHGYVVVRALQVLEMMARPERFELPTSWFVAMRSIQLSYGRKIFDVPSLGRSGGERGIRTLDGLLTHTPLAGVRLRPLGHLSGARSANTSLEE